jgi:hypothetical protein
VASSRILEQLETHAKYEFIAALSAVMSEAEMAITRFESSADSRTLARSAGDEFVSGFSAVRISRADSGEPMSRVIVASASSIVRSLKSLCSSFVSLSHSAGYKIKN